MASGLYNAFKLDLMDGSVNLANGADVIHVGLYDVSHAFAAGDTIYTTTNELPTAGGYTRDGKTLANQALSGTTTVAFDADDTAWTSATFSTYHAVIYDETNADSLICSIDFGGEQTVTAGTFTIEWNASGIISLA